MANMNLVTGFAGTPHVTAEDAGVLNAVILGPGQYVMNYGNKLKASVITNNLVRVLDGVVMMQGRQIRIAENTNVELSIDNGSTGYNRNDLIVARYTKYANSGIEEANLVVIKGTATTGEAADPTYTSGNIFGGAVQNDMPLYRIPIEGINAKEPVALFDVASGFADAIVGVEQHMADKANPHGVTPEQIGAAKSEHEHAYNEITGAPVFSYDANTGTLTITKG